MKELIEYIAKAIVDKPEEVKVTEVPRKTGLSSSFKWRLRTPERSSVKRGELPRLCAPCCE